MFKVFIAEDDFRVAQIHERYLASVEEMSLVGKALNAKETLQFVTEHQVDLILLDVYLPDQLGTELLHQIRKLSPNVDIIMITASKEKAFLEKATKYGVQQYLLKPVTMNQFQKAMEQYKGKKKMLQSISEVNQEMVDQFFGRDLQQPKEFQLPPGIDAMTLKKVRELLTDKKGITSEKAGERLGASRTTARRYLEYLVGINQATVEQVYGIVGRPERRYYT